MLRCIPIVLSALLTGAAAPLAAQDDLQARAKAASAVADGNFQLFYVPSSGIIADETCIVTSKTKDSSRVATQLAKIIVAGSTTDTTIAVSGSSERKTVQVVADALTIIGKKQLPILRIIYVGTVPAARELEPKVVAVGGQLKFAPL
ncbi:MAG: hypothetical protein KF790_11810 [Steroidobacteraceae bacterium]|nr:hypothetical protein [Steroidobacteraceae bacterium]